MKTPHLDNKINELQALRSRGELTYMGGEMLSEFNQIKRELSTDNENKVDYKKEYYILKEKVSKMLVENRRNHETPMTPFELLRKWDKIRELKR